MRTIACFASALLLASALFARLSTAAEHAYIEISYGPDTETCPAQGLLHRAVGRPPEGLHLVLRFRRTQNGYAADLRVSGRLQGTRTLQAPSCAELEGAVVLNVKLLDRIARLNNAQERAEKVAALLTASANEHGEPRVFDTSDADIHEAFLATPSRPRADRYWVNELNVPAPRDRYERWSPNVDVVGLFGVVRNGALALSVGTNWRFHESYRLTAAIIFAPPRSVETLSGNNTTAMLGISTGICRTLIRNWSVSALEACGSLISGGIHIASGPFSADTPWFGMSTELVLDASVTRNVGVRMRGGAIIPFYNPSSSSTELAGAYESLKLGAVTGVGLVAHFE